VVVAGPLAPNVPRDDPGVAARADGDVVAGRELAGDMEMTRVVEPHGNHATARVVAVVAVDALPEPAEVGVGAEVERPVLDADPVDVAPQVEHLAAALAEVEIAVPVESKLELAARTGVGLPVVVDATLEPAEARVAAEVERARLDADPVLVVPGRRPEIEHLAGLLAEGKAAGGDFDHVVRPHLQHVLARVRTRADREGRRRVVRLAQAEPEQVAEGIGGRTLPPESQLDPFPC